MNDQNTFGGGGGIFDFLDRAGDFLAGLGDALGDLAGTLSDAGDLGEQGTGGTFNAPTINPGADRNRALLIVAGLIGVAVFIGRG